MATHIVLVENYKDWNPHYSDALVVTAKDYVAHQEYLKIKDIKIVNLCRSYRYLSLGYYCSLLAEARRHKVVPSVKTINDLSSKSIYSLNVEDLDVSVQKSLKKRTKHLAETATSFDYMIYFGQCEENELQELARQLFDMFRCPILKVEFRFQGKWNIFAIKPSYVHNLMQGQEAIFFQAFNDYLTKRWQTPKVKSKEKYDLAILYNPAEQLPPSNHRSLQKFIKIGKKLDVNIDLIEKKDYSKLAEYDALFIRETTRINHHTFRFAKKAENEGMVVIDDPDSIVKCTNKVYLFEILSANKVPVPKTVLLQKKDINRIIKALELKFSYPIVLKIPDSSFSRGVVKADNLDELKEITSRLFEESDLILAQEFLYTSFDWRIGILNRVPIYACQYFMSKKHWQIIQHGPDGRFTGGDFKTFHVEDVPQDVIYIAVKAANLIGNGLYGVDLKQTDKGVLVMEINDNPTIDVGVEDGCLGDKLYRIIIEEFIRRLNMKNGEKHEK